MLYALASLQPDATTEISDREMALAEIYGFYPKPKREKLTVHSTVSAEIPIENIKKDNTEFPDMFQPYRLVKVETVQTQEAWQSNRQVVSDSGKLTTADMNSWDAAYPTPKAQPIVPWTRLWPKLRQAVACRHHAGIDYKRLTDCVARGVVIRQLPRKTRLSWPNPLTVVLDFSDRLTPYWDDWHWLRERLQTRLHQQIRFFRLRGMPQNRLQALADGKPEGPLIGWPDLPAGSTLLLLSDLGMVDAAHPWPVTCWEYKLNDFRRKGVRVVVFAPVSIRHLQASMVNSAQTVRLSPDSSLRSVARMRTDTEALSLIEGNDYAGCSTLLSMLSVATRVEPALLRELRQCLPDDGRDAGLEGEVWCHQHLDTSALACAISPYAVKDWRDLFKKLDADLQQRTLDCLRNWHARLPQAIHHEETLVWFYLASSQVNETEIPNINRARAFFERVTHSLQNRDKSAPNLTAFALQLQLADRHQHWVSPVLGTREAYLNQLSIAVALADPVRTALLPEGLDPVAWLQALPAQTSQKLILVQQADGQLSLNAEFTQSPLEWGISPLAELELDRPAVLWAWAETGQAHNYRPWHWQETQSDAIPELPDLLVIPDASIKPVANLYLHTGQQQLCFERITKPAWAKALGQDGYGIFADLEVKGITQRFRWINPGTFWMGSPMDEPLRSEDELLHQVTLTQGYWLSDTACTQALWLAVMSNNPSAFKDNPNNPVETVSWYDVQGFIQRLNQEITDLLTRLPTEAEWEYACRAGTETPFSFGDNITTDQVNYNGNYPYSGSAKGEFRKKTVAVKTLPPNSWGLYEMHGNVWEWCQDKYGNYPSFSKLDSDGPETDLFRVLHGGSLNSRARYTRSAYRNGRSPGGRYDDYGFRLALGEKGVSPAQQQGRQPVTGRTVGGIRLHKFLAQYGKYGSLRSIEEEIRRGKILLNGQKVSIGDHYYPGDTVQIDGRPLDLSEFSDKTEVILYYKAKGEVVSRTDSENRPTVFEQLPEPQQGRWLTVGRMGIQNEGLLLLTTNGELANKLSQKIRSIPFTYKVRVFGEIDSDAAIRLTEGIVTEDGNIIRVESIKPLGGQESANQWYEIRINDGRSANLDAILKSQAIVLNRVIRTKFADIELPKDMKAREYKMLLQEQCVDLMALVGL